MTNEPNSVSGENTSPDDTTAPHAEWDAGDNVPVDETTATHAESDAGAGDPVDDTTASDPDSIAKRFFSWQTVGSFGLALVVLAFVVRGMNIDLKDSLRQMRRADPLLFVGALAVYYLTFVIRGIRWRMMLQDAGINARAGHALPGVMGMALIFVLSWFANSILPARLGDAYRSFLLKQRTRASFGVSFGTILAERLIDLVVLVTVLLVSGLIVFGTHTPDKAEQAFVAGALVVVIGIIGVLTLWFLRDQIDRFMPQRIAVQYRKVRDGLFASLRRPLAAGAISVLLWMLDGLRVFLVAQSLGAHISYPAGVMTALISALVSIIPFTPAGLGFVEGFMVTALTQIGVSPSTAAAIALLDRVVTYLSLIIIGIPLYIWTLRHPGRESGS